MPKPAKPDVGQQQSTSKEQMRTVDKVIMTVLQKVKGLGHLCARCAVHLQIQIL